MPSEFLTGLAANLRLSGIEIETIEVVLSLSGKGEKNYDPSEVVRIARNVGQMPMNELLAAASKSSETKATAAKLLNELAYLSGPKRYQRMEENARLIAAENAKQVEEGLQLARRTAAVTRYARELAPTPAAVAPAPVPSGPIRYGREPTEKIEAIHNRPLLHYTGAGVGLPRRR